VKEHYERGSQLVETIFGQGPLQRLFYINGDHNNMANVISGWHRAHPERMKPIVINLDFHSDARKSEDGPHSGTWLSDAYLRKEVAHTYIVGLSLLTNSEACIENLESFGVTYRAYTWDEI
jgi:arginase family enzyme